MLEVVTTKDGRPAFCGEMDLMTVPVLESVLAQLHGRCDVDLSGVTFFDSSSLRVFLLHHRLNPELRIVNPSKTVVKVLEVTGTFDCLVRTSEKGAHICG